MAQRIKDGRVVKASRVWRKTEPVSDEVRVKPYEKALAEARQKLANPEAYEVGDWNWGFREPAGNVCPEEMSLVYEFAFAPLETVDPSVHPPQRVEVPGEETA